MKSYPSALQWNDPIPSPPTYAFPSSLRIPEPGKTVLVVDDDWMVCSFEAHLLRQEGYTVLQAEGASEALRLAREAAAIHLLITDFSMPDVDGLELTHQFRLLHRKAPVLMVSGSFPPTHRRVRDLDRFDFLAKPFHHDELLNKVRKLLDATVPLPVRKPTREH